MSDADSIQSRADDVAADVQPEDLAGARLGLVGIGRELDAAGLAAPAGQHLRLDDDRPTELLRRLPRLLGSGREPTLGHGDPVAREELLALILVEVQSGRESILRACCGSFSCSSCSSPAGCGTDAQPEPTAPVRPAEPQTAELGWREAYPSTGPQLRFHVDRLVVLEDGWSADIAVENATSIPFGLATLPVDLEFGLMLFATGSLDELESASRNGTLPSLRRATAIEPPPPATIAPGATWRATLSAPGSLVDGSFVRVSFGTFVAQGEPPPGMEPEVVWITDKAYRL